MAIVEHPISYLPLLRWLKRVNIAVGTTLAALSDRSLVVLGASGGIGQVGSSLLKKNEQLHQC